MATSENVFHGSKENIETYLSLLETTIGQMDKTVREIGVCVHHLGSIEDSQSIQQNLEDFHEKVDLVKNEAIVYSKELLALFPMIEDGIINLDGDERKVFLGFRGRYDVVRNDLTNIRRGLMEHCNELHQMGIN